MPTTKEGLQRLLDFFVYGMLRAAESLGNAPLFLRTVEEEGLRKFLLINFPKFQASENPKEACEAYTKSIDEGGLFVTTDTTFTRDDEVDLDLCDPPRERTPAGREMPVRLPGADATEPRGPDGRDGVRRGGRPRRRAHPRRRDDPEGGREGRVETVDGIPPADDDDEEGHRRDGPGCHRLARGPRGPREVRGSPHGALPPVRVAARPRSDHARPRGGGLGGVLPRTRGPATATGRDVPRGRDHRAQDAPDLGRRDPTPDPGPEDAGFTPQDGILRARVRRRPLPSHAGHQSIGGPCQIRSSVRAARR